MKWEMFGMPFISTYPRRAKMSARFTQYAFIAFYIMVETYMRKLTKYHGS